MPRPNTIENHPELKGIIADRIGKMPIPAIAEKYGVSEKALYRWQENYLEKYIAKAKSLSSQALAPKAQAQAIVQERTEEKRTTFYEEVASEVIGNLKRIGSKAEDSGSFGAAVTAQDKIISAARFIGEARGDFKTHAETTVQVVVAIPSAPQEREEWATVDIPSISE